MKIKKWSFFDTPYLRFILYCSTFIALAVSSVLAFAVAPAERILGESSRLLYVHVPLAVSAVLAFVLSGVHAALYLAKGTDTGELRFHSAALLGTFFTVLTTITGAAWARVAWGTWWNWDPRETSILFLLAVYAAYFALYSSRKNGQGRLRAAYLLFSAAVMPFFVFVAPRIYPSLHPDTIINAKNTLQLDSTMRLALFTSMAAYALLTLTLFDLTVRTALLGKKQGAQK